MYSAPVSSKLVGDEWIVCSWNAWPAALWQSNSPLKFKADCWTYKKNVFQFHCNLKQAGLFPVSHSLSHNMFLEVDGVCCLQPLHGAAFKHRGGANSFSHLLTRPCLGHAPFPSVMGTVLICVAMGRSLELRALFLTSELKHVQYKTVSTLSRNTIFWIILFFSFSRMGKSTLATKIWWKITSF